MVAGVEPARREDTGGAGRGTGAPSRAAAKNWRRIAGYCRTVTAAPVVPDVGSCVPGTDIGDLERDAGEQIELLVDEV